jgi:8-oxo-dGTP pyrophosphatase MutT (NUDIX family)
LKKGRRKKEEGRRKKEEGNKLLIPNPYYPLPITHYPLPIMYKSGEIRVLALGLITQRDRIFVSQGYDPGKQETFYRIMGGGIEFGEHSREALQREFQEEIQAELTNIKYLGCMESLFQFRGKPGHEIIFIYQCDFLDPKYYQLEQIEFSEKERKKIALWVPIEKFKSGELRLVPENFCEYCHL